MGKDLAVVDLSNRYLPESDVTFEKLDDATVIVHLGTGRVYHTNATGTRIWELLQNGNSLQEILDGLADEFEGLPEQVRHELEDFVERLSSEKIISKCGHEGEPRLPR